MQVKHEKHSKETTKPVGFNGDFLFEILKNMTSERVVLKMKDSSTAVVIEDEEPEEGVTYLALLMPVKLPSAN